MGASAGAKIASSTSRTMMMPPNTTLLLFRIRLRVDFVVGRSATVWAARSVIAHPGVEEAVGQVDQQVDQHEQEREHQDRALDDGEVAGVDRLDDEAADAGPGEHDLGHHGTAEQRSELYADDGDDRQQGVAESMLVNDDVVAQAFGAGGAHVVTVEHFQQAGTHQARHQRQDRGAEGKRRQQQVTQVVPQSLEAALGEQHAQALEERGAAAEQRQPADVQSHGTEQYQRQPEVWQRHAQQRHEHAAEVDPAVAVGGGQYTERDAQDDGQHQRGDRQLDGGAHAFTDELGNRSALPERSAEVTGQRPAGPAQVLDGQRLVEAVQLVELPYLLGLGALTQHHPDGIAGG